MVRRICKIVAIVMMLAWAGVSSVAYARSQWEAVRSEQVPESKTVAKDVDFELRAVRGSLYVATNHAVQIKIYTILGQLVASDNLQPGTFKMTFSSHGVYIVKIGELTCKVAV